MHLAVIGCGYVGLVTGLCLASFGHHVVCVDLDQSKVDALQKGHVPFFEPGLEAFSQSQLSHGRVEFSPEINKAADAAAVFIAVGTPSLPDGGQDLGYIWAALKSLAPILAPNALIITKSTVSPGTNRRLHEWLREHGYKQSVIHNPEFLREGSALEDSLHPDRVAIGMSGTDGWAKGILESIFQTYSDRTIPFIWTNWESAELIKYTSNALLASRVAFINEIARLSEIMGANISTIAQGVGADHRIGPYFLNPGPGFGGSCFPKDLRALVKLGVDAGVPIPLLESISRSNQVHQELMVERIAQRIGKPLAGLELALLGASFKANTDDLRESPALAIIDGLLRTGTSLRVYDPKALPGLERKYGSALNYFTVPEEALIGADAAVILTEWEPIKAISESSWSLLSPPPTIIDLRNILTGASWLKNSGIRYFGLGLPGELR